MSAAPAVAIDAAVSTAAAVKILKGFTGSLRVEARTTKERSVDPRLPGSEPFAVRASFCSTPASIDERRAHTRRSEAAEFLIAACHRSMTDGRRFDDDASYGFQIAFSPDREPASGNRTVKVAPSPSLLSIPRRPRWRLSTCLTSESPSPVPPSARLWPT